MTKTNDLTNLEPEGSFTAYGDNLAFHTPSSSLGSTKKNHSRRWKYTKPDLIKTCFICDSQIKVKYNLPKEKYSLKNNWGYWTQKESDQKKHICNSCIMKLHIGKMSDWITNKDKAGDFYQYVYRGQFNQE